LIWYYSVTENTKVSLIVTIWSQLGLKYKHIFYHKINLYCAYFSNVCVFCSFYLCVSLQWSLYEYFTNSVFCRSKVLTDCFHFSGNWGY